MERNIINYFKKLDNPPSDRTRGKYYEEIQQLAYNLVRYLRMDDDKNEHQYQGSHNLTFLIENMTVEDFEFVLVRFMRRVPINRLKDLIKKALGETTYNQLFTDCNEIKMSIRNIEQQLDNIKEKLNI